MDLGTPAMQEYIYKRKIHVAMRLINEGENMRRKNKFIHLGKFENWRGLIFSKKIAS